MSLYGLVRRIEKKGISSSTIEEFAQKFGREGLDWLGDKNASQFADGMVRKLLNADDLSKFTDDVLKAIKESAGYADSIISAINKYGDDAAKAIVKYGDDAAELIEEYGDKAVKYFSIGSDVEQAKKLAMGITDAEAYSKLVDGATDVIGEYSDSVSSSQILRQELYNAGIQSPPYKNAAHHIVPVGDKRAAEARAILEKYDIDLNSAVNGVFLPMEASEYAGSASLHIGGHSAEYCETVVQQLNKVVKAGGVVSRILLVNWVI